MKNQFISLHEIITAMIGTSIRKVLFIWTKLLVVLITGLYCIVSYWLFWPYKPYIVDGPIEILNEDYQVEPGGRLIYEMRFTKNLALPATIYKQLINDFIITYSPITGNVPAGDRVMRVKQRIPRSAECGSYVFKWEAHTKVNPFRTIITTVMSEPFEVVEKNEW